MNCSKKKKKKEDLVVKSGTTTTMSSRSTQEEEEQQSEGPTATTIIERVKDVVGVGLGAAAVFGVESRSVVGCVGLTLIACGARVRVRAFVLGAAIRCARRLALITTVATVVATPPREEQQPNKYFLTKREETVFESICTPAQIAKIEIAMSAPKILVVEVQEQKTTFGHFVEKIVASRSVAVAVAAEMNRKLKFKNCDYEDKHLLLNDCGDRYTDFEEFFGLPNNTRVAWGKSRRQKLRTIQKNETLDSAKMLDDPAIAISLGLAAKFAASIGVRVPQHHLKNNCFVFATTRPVGDAYDHLQPLASQTTTTKRIYGLHVRTGYADHASDMDEPFVEKKNNNIVALKQIHQFNIQYPDLFYQSRDVFVRNSTEWMDLDFAAFSPRREATKDKSFDCVLFRALALSKIVTCLDRLGQGLVIATDHAKYQPLLNSLVRKSRLLAPPRVRNKAVSDVYGHATYVTKKKDGGPDFDALGIVAAIEFHLLTWCDLLIVYGSSFFSHAASLIAVPLDSKLVSFNLPRPTNSTDITHFCNRGCFDAPACSCVHGTKEFRTPKSAPRDTRAFFFSA